MKATVLNAAIIFGTLAAINFGWSLYHPSVVNDVTGCIMIVMGLFCISIADEPKKQAGDHP